MNKVIYICLFLSSCMVMTSSFAQSNDEKAIKFLNAHMHIMFKVLNSKPQIISPTCMDSLKKLHDFKDKIIKDSNTQNDIDMAILRALYTNSIQFCETDVQAICSKRTEPSIRKNCTDLSVQNN